MALVSDQLHTHPGIFHALIVLLSGLYLTGIPVFNLSQGHEGWFTFHCFPPCVFTHVTVPAHTQSSY